MDVSGTSQVEVIPLFPLGSVLVPGLLLPLHVFEQRYRDLLHDLEALPQDERAFGVVAIREGHEVGNTGVTALYDVGTTAVIRQIEWFEDGRASLVATGQRRFRLLGLEAGKDYLQGRVRWLDEPDGDDTAALAYAVRARLAIYRAAIEATGVIEAPPIVAIPDDPRFLSYLVAAAAMLDLADRQHLLEAADTASRLRSELSLLRRELALLTHLHSIPAVDLARTGFTLN